MLVRLPSTGRPGLRRSGRRSALWLAACLIGLGCQPPAGDGSGIALSWTVAPDPPATGPAAFSLTLTDEATGQPVERARVRLEGNMSHPGMKPVFGTAREVAPGRYEGALELTMAGDWILLVEAELRDGRSLRRQADLRGVRAR